MEKQKKIPVLRFPDFADDWQLKKIGALTERVTNPVDVQDDKLYSQIGIRSHGKGIFYKEAVTGKSLGNKRVFWVKENTFIVNIVFAWEQAVAKTTEKETGMIASHRFPMYSPVETQSDLDYLLQFFLTRKGKSLLELASPGGAGRNKTLGQKEFENLKFLVPNVAEQTKIASFISSVNNKINQLKQKKNLLEQYKKGVMQKLFSQELRFKDENGNEFPKWEKKNLGKVSQINPKCEKLPESFIYIDLESVVKGRLNKEDRISIEDAPSRAQRLLRKDDILFQMVRPYQKNNFFFDKTENDYVASTGYAQIRTSHNPQFLFQLLHTVEFVNNVIERCTGTGYPAINSTDLSNIEVKMPSVNEQTKIANFLSTLDEKINRTENQIQQTGQYKKGLLQNMFV